MSTESMQNPCGAGVFVIGATSHVRIRISTTSHHTHTRAMKSKVLMIKNQYHHFTLKAKCVLRKEGWGQFTLLNGI